MNKARQVKIKALLDGLSVEEKARLCSGADDWHTEAFRRKGVPAIMMADGPHGLRKEREKKTAAVGESYPATCFPTASAMGCSFDRELMKEVGAAIAEEAARAGVSIVLGPGINIKRSPLCGRNFEYFSEDPHLSGEMGAAWVTGVQQKGIGACVKHFAANNQETSRFVSNSCVDMRALQEIYLEGFRKVVEQAKPVSVMSSYNLVNNEYAGESRFLLGEMLRNRWRFEGLVVSDWGAVNDRVAALKAGLDLEMPGKTSATTEDILAALRTKRLTMEELDAAVLRILATVDTAERGRMVTGAVNYELHHTLARRAAANSAVLMKNDGGLLPFDDGKPFAVIGHFAKAARYQGTGSSRINPAKEESALDALEKSGLPYVYAEGCNADGSTNDLLVGEAREAAKEAGRAVIFIGLPDTYESEGFDREDMRLPDGMLKLVDAIASACDDIAVVLMLGSPVELPFINRVKSIVCCYLGGQAVGPAAVDVVTGKVNPGAKLAESWAKKLSDTPCNNYYNKGKKLAEYREGIFVGYRYYDAVGIEPQFSFGHGLSYTEFEYRNLALDRNSITERNRLTFSVDIKNTGARQGSEVVQVYLAKKGDAYKELKAFEKVFLFPGESRTLHFTLHWKDFAYFNTETDRLELESGTVSLMVGSGSRDIRAAADVTVYSQRNREKPGYILPEEAANLSDERFYEILGFVPEEPDWKPLTLNSTLFELSHSLEGKLIVRQMKGAYLASLPADMDETTRLMIERSLDNMPIRALAALSGGRLSKNTAVAIVHFANHRLLRGLFRLLKKKR